MLTTSQSDVTCREFRPRFWQQRMLALSSPSLFLYLLQNYI